MRKKRFSVEEAFSELDNLIANLKPPVVEFVVQQEGDPFKILIATILSSRTNDIITTKVIERLFKVVKGVQDIDKVSIEELEKLIYPVGFYRQKAIQLKKLPQVLKDNFEGKIPDEIDDLINLPGVGRKTANLVRWAAFGKPAICVDTHVHRISNRWGLVQTLNPEETEMKLREILPLKYWGKINHYLVSLGQTICKPRNPRCDDCPLEDNCLQIGILK